MFCRRFVAAAACIMLLAAFTYPTQLKPVAQGTSLPPGFVDGRPAKQLKSGFESLLITNCAYASVRIGDEDIEPDLALLLAEMLQQRFGERLQGKAVELKAFTVHLNGAAAMRAQMAQMYTGLIPNLMNKREKVGCAPDDLQGGYTLGEVPAGTTPLVLVIDIEIDQQPFHARAIAPFAAQYPPRKRAGDDAKRQWNDAVDSLARVLLTRLGDDIGERMFGDPPSLPPLPSDSDVAPAPEVSPVGDPGEAGQVPAPEGQAESPPQGSGH